ncbi:TAXI family TRAP transporter solute-binding subunit [Salipiger mucosus]|uniref:TRAP transporter solute receptor, TAXI family n=1 Tax=Salipiger mucosus DSM 16094 TaxID=1123237 RepID=S9Q9A3_9RHOB|nr:TAXI family TRAP transporter solute-binding subunit [Salipiger mucosus]EPX77961.1 TRAP transporter solute receptor, TAXI family precursor [Salipiger mucosus DSM 16094]
MTYRFNVAARAVAAFFVVGASAMSAQAESFVMATGSQGGSWFPVGGAIKAAVEKARPDISITVTPGAGIANVVGVDTGRFPIGFANSISTVDGQKGRAPFREATEGVCNLGVLYPQYFQIIALDSAEINSVEDFAGKRLTTQQNGHTGELLTRAALEALGLSYDDLDDVSHVSYSDSASMMKDGHADVFTLGTAMPAGAVMDIASSRDIDVVGVSEELFETFKAQNAAFQMREVPAGAYPGVDEPKQAITYDTHMVADCEFDGEIVKAVLSGVLDNLESMGSINKAMADLTAEDMAADIGVPMHPAAKEFYEERGVSFGG